MENVEDILNEYTCGIAVVFEDEVIHVVGYPEKPTKIDTDHLKIELVEDKSLGLELEQNDNFQLYLVENEGWKELLEQWILK